MKISKNYIKDGIRAGAKFISQELEIEATYKSEESRRTLVSNIAKQCGSDRAFLQPEVVNMVARINGKEAIEEYLASLFTAYGKDVLPILVMAGIQVNNDNEFVMFCDDPANYINLAYSS